MNRRCAAMLLAIIATMPAAAQTINITQWPPGQDALILDQPQTTYQLQADIATTGTQGIIISHHDITLDGQGHSFSCQSCTAPALQANDINYYAGNTNIKNISLNASENTALAIKINNSYRVTIENAHISGDINITNSETSYIESNRISGKITLANNNRTKIYRNVISSQGCTDCALIDVAKESRGTIYLNSLSFSSASGPAIRITESTNMAINENKIEFAAAPGAAASGITIEYPVGSHIEANFGISLNNISAVAGGDTIGINSTGFGHTRANFIRAKTCIEHKGEYSIIIFTDCKAEYEGLVLHSPSENAQIWSNTIFANGDALRVAVGENATAIKTRNNIFYSQNGYAMKGDFKYAMPVDGDYNDFGSDDHNESQINILNSDGNPAAFSLDQYSRSSGSENHSIEVMPMFISVENGDLKIAGFSPCVDAGDPTFEVPPGGGTRTDIGAHEV